MVTGDQDILYHSKTERIGLASLGTWINGWQLGPSVASRCCSSYDFIRVSVTDRPGACSVRRRPQHQQEEHIGWWPVSRETPYISRSESSDPLDSSCMQVLPIATTGLETLVGRAV